MKNYHYSRITEDEPQEMRCGCLACVSHQHSQHWVTCRLCLTEQPKPLFHLFNNMCGLEQWFTVANGVPTALLLVYVGSHATVNHSLHFVDPVTGVHTQTIESYWNRAKLRLKKMKGVSEQQLPSHLDEFMWRERFGQTSPDAFNSIIRDIARQYPV